MEASSAGVKSSYGYNDPFHGLYAEHFLRHAQYPLLNGFYKPPGNPFNYPPPLPHSTESFNKPPPHISTPQPPPSLTEPPPPSRHPPPPPSAPPPPQPPPSASSFSEPPPTNGWIFGSERFSWDNSLVASYNPETKMFRCVACNTVGFLSRIAEHYLGTHANARVFQCPHCPYSSAWSRCVRMHLWKHHGVQNTPGSLWKGQPLLDEISRLLQNLKNLVEAQDKSKDSPQENRDTKRYICPKCPYATDRRDLYTRHENIHREDKPFHCYACFKMFNRADHVKKHFLRIHKDQPYDVRLIRRYPPKNHTSTSTWPSFNGLFWQNHYSAISSSSNSNNPTPAPPMPSPSCPSPAPITMPTLAAALAAPALSPPSESSSDTTTLKADAKKSARSFNCSYCSWQGVDGWCLRRHLNTHIKPFSCSLCDYKAARAERLSTHVSKVHNKKVCNRCGFMAEDEQALEQHVKQYHNGSSDKSRFGCTQCGEPFETRSDLETHCIIAHNQALLECGVECCDFRTTNPTILEDHQKKRHGLQLGPTEQQSVSSNINICCPICGCGFANLNSLKTHHLVIHQQPLRERSSAVQVHDHPFRCTVCGYTCSAQQTIMEHMCVHSGTIHRCQAGNGCNFCTAFECLLRDHVLHEHKEDGVVQCPHCGFPSSSKSSFTWHFKEAHHPVACKLCRRVEARYFGPRRQNANKFLAKLLSLGSGCVSVSENHTLIGPSTSQTLEESKCRSAESSSNKKTISSSPSMQSQGESTLQSEGRRARKQSTPRKIIRSSDLVNSEAEKNLCNGGIRPLVNGHGKESSMNRGAARNKWIFMNAFYEKLERWAEAPLHCCRLCRQRRWSVLYRSRANLLLHAFWRHEQKVHKCKSCDLRFRYRYQLFLHKKREHKC